MHLDNKSQPVCIYFEETFTFDYPVFLIEIPCTRGVDFILKGSEVLRHVYQ